MAGNSTVDDVRNANVAALRRQQWAARISWYVYGLFVVLCYVGIFSYVGIYARPAVRMLVATKDSFAARLHQIGEAIDELLFHDFEFLPILFCAAAFPLIAAYVVRGFFLSIVIRDMSWIRTAIWMLAGFSLASMAVKLALAGIRGSRLEVVIFHDLEYFGMCALPLVMAGILLAQARFVKANTKSAS